MYKLSPKDLEGKTNMVCLIERNLWIPLSDPANTDYQAYLKWVADGNEPLPAENE